MTILKDNLSESFLEKPLSLSRKTLGYISVAGDRKESGEIITMSIDEIQELVHGSTGTIIDGGDNKIDILFQRANDFFQQQFFGYIATIGYGMLRTGREDFIFLKKGDIADPGVFYRIIISPDHKKEFSSLLYEDISSWIRAGGGALGSGETLILDNNENIVILPSPLSSLKEASLDDWVRAEVFIPT